MKRILAAVFGFGMMLGPMAADASAQVDRSSPQERACKAKYDGIFANINSTAPNRRKVTDDEIGWALDHEKTLRLNEPCSLNPRSEQKVVDSQQAAVAKVDVVAIEPGGGGNALAGQAAFNAGDLATARTKYQLGCFTDGVGASCNNLGSMATKGQGGPKDLALARKAYQLGCTKGLAKSCEVFGSMLKSGSGGLQDYAGSVAPLATACKANLATSCYDLGTNYFYGKVGRAPDFALARQYLAKSCPGYAADGCYALALMQRDGQGGAVDAAGAAKSFDLSCKAGKSDGCLEFGVAQYTGAGLAPDQAGARVSFGKACNTGNAGACMNAGMMARDGQGGTIDRPAAKRFFGLGCKLGIQDGCAEAGRLGA